MGLDVCEISYVEESMMRIRVGGLLRCIWKAALSVHLDERPLIRLDGQ